MKKLLFIVVPLLFASAAVAATVYPVKPFELHIYKTETLRASDSGNGEGTQAYVSSSNQTYVKQQDTWVPLGASPLFDMTFDDGASKGLSLIEQDFTAYSTTADATNIVTYGNGAQTVRFQVTTNTTAVGTITPTADATGLDLMVGGGDNDEATYTWGAPGTSGAPIIPGLTPAGQFCAKLKIHDVSGSDGCFVMLATPGVPVDLSSGDPNYTSYCGIGNVSGTLYVSDNTTGPTTTTNTWADDAEKEVCVHWSSVGACTYTIDGSAPTATDAHTLSASAPVVPRVQCINASDLSDDLWLTRARVAFE